jgi:hypothetical protein
MKGLPGEFDSLVAVTLQPRCGHSISADSLVAVTLFAFFQQFRGW